MPEGSTVLLSLPQLRVASYFCFPALTIFFLSRSYLKRNPRPLAPKSLRGSAPPHPAPGPARPLSRRAGRSSVTRLLFFFCPLPLPCVRPGGAFTGSFRTFQAFGRALDSLSLQSVPGGSSAAGSTCSRLVAASLPTPRRPSPARPSAQLSRGVRPEDVPRPLPAGQSGLVKRRHAPRLRHPRWAGSGRGSRVCSRGRRGPQAAAGEGRVRLHCRAGSSGESARRAPSAPPTARGGRPVAAPKSAGAACKCRCDRGDRGRDRWCGSPLSVVCVSQGLARSGCGRRGLDRAGARGLSHSLPPPPRGVWAAAAPSPVHGAPAPRSPPPGPALPTFRLSPSHWLPGRPGPAVPFSFLGFLLLFLSSPAGLFLSPSPIRQSAPPPPPPFSLLTRGFQNC